MGDGQCDSCGESVDLCDVNVEAFEITGGEILCPMCAEAVFEEDGE